MDRGQLKQGYVCWGEGGEIQLGKGTAIIPRSENTKFSVSETPAKAAS